MILIDADTEDGTLEDQVTLIYWVTDDVSATDYGNTLGTVQVEVFDALPVSVSYVATDMSKDS